MPSCTSSKPALVVLRLRVMLRFPFQRPFSTLTHPAVLSCLTRKSWFIDQATMTFKLGLFLTVSLPIKPIGSSLVILYTQKEPLLRLSTTTYGIIPYWHIIHQAQAHTLRFQRIFQRFQDVIHVFLLSFSCSHRQTFRRAQHSLRLLRFFRPPFSTYSVSGGHPHLLPPNSHSLLPGCRSTQTNFILWSWQPFSRFVCHFCSPAAFHQVALIFVRNLVENCIRRMHAR